MQKKDITKIERLLRDADFMNTPEAYSSLYNQLRSMDNEYPSDYLLDYYKGLACYSNPDVEEFMTKWAINHFDKSLELNPAHIMSKVYLGHCRYDLGEYKKALALFKEILSVNDNWLSFNKNDQQWRLVNLAEMVALCNLKLGRLHKFQFYYMPWKELYYLHIRKDNFYFPESLVIDTASFLKVKGDSMSDENITFFRKVSLDLIGIIKGGDGFEDIYSSELKTLKNWKNHSNYQPIKVYSV